MSKVSVGILFAAVGLITLGTYFNVPFVAGGSGVVLVVGLCYSYVVAKREMERVSEVLREEKEERNNAAAKTAPVPEQVVPQGAGSDSKAQFV